MSPSVVETHVAQIGSPRWRWLTAVRGLFGVIFGVLAFIAPRMTIALLVLWFGAYAIVDGVSALALARRLTQSPNLRLAVHIEGAIGIAVGAVTFLWPHITTFALLFLIAVWAGVTGISKLAEAFQAGRANSGSWLLAISGLISVGFGVLLIVFPNLGTLALAWMIGSYALFLGVTALGLSLRSRERERRRSTHPSA